MLLCFAIFVGSTFLLRISASDSVRQIDPRYILLEVIDIFANTGGPPIDRLLGL